MKWVRSAFSEAKSGPGPLSKLAGCLAPDSLSSNIPLGPDTIGINITCPTSFVNVQHEDYIMTPRILRKGVEYSLSVITISMGRGCVESRFPQTEELSDF